MATDLVGSFPREYLTEVLSTKISTLSCLITCRKERSASNKWRASAYMMRVGVECQVPADTRGGPLVGTSIAPKPAREASLAKIEVAGGGIGAMASGRVIAMVRDSGRGKGRRHGDGC